MFKRLFVASFLIVALVSWTAFRATSSDGANDRVADAVTDTDGDGFSDQQETDWATNPNDPVSHPLKDATLSACWTLDQTSGNSVTDASGKGQTAYLDGAIPPQWDAADAALVFDGKQNQLRVPNSESVSPLRTFTVSTWIRVPVGSEGLIIGKWPAEGTQGSYALALMSGRLALAMSFQGNYRPLFGQQIVTDGEWHFVAATCEGNVLSLYVDGKLDVQTHTGGLIDQINQPLLLGLMEGKLSDVRIYDRALRHDEVILVYELATSPVDGERTARRRPQADEPLQLSSIPPTVAPNEPIRLRAIERVVHQGGN